MEIHAKKNLLCYVTNQQIGITFTQSISSETYGQLYIQFEENKLCELKYPSWMVHSTINHFRNAIFVRLKNIYNSIMVRSGAINKIDIIWFEHQPLKNTTTGQIIYTIEID